MPRDNFPEGVKRGLAARVGYRCSNPICGALTAGPSSNMTDSVSIGVAAHITAAASGGPRFDPAMTPSVRASIGNGIWLCQNCACLVDRDPSRFTVETLKQWKSTAEQHAESRLGQPSPFDSSFAPTFSVPRRAVSDNPPLGRRLIAGPSRGELLNLIAVTENNIDKVSILAEGEGGSGQLLTIVATSTNHEWDWRVSLYAAGELGWELIAYTDLHGQKGWSPEAFYVPGKPGALAITHVDTYGTAVFRRVTTWYRLTRGAVRPFLAIPRYFYIVGFGLPFSRHLKCELLATPQLLRHGQTLSLGYSVSYNFEDTELCDLAGHTLLVESGTFSLVWDEDAETFTPDSFGVGPEMLNRIWSEDVASFMDRNKTRINDLLSFGNTYQKAFIRDKLLPIYPVSD